jgi:hypothetical protein
MPAGSGGGAFINDTNMALGYGEINHFFSVWISKREK